jgi:hypothetical protein
VQKEKEVTMFISRFYMAQTCRDTVLYFLRDGNATP